MGRWPSCSCMRGVCACFLRLLVVPWRQRQHIWTRTCSVLLLSFGCLYGTLRADGVVPRGTGHRGGRRARRARAGGWDRRVRPSRAFVCAYAFPVSQRATECMLIRISRIGCHLAYSQCHSVTHLVTHSMRTCIARIRRHSTCANRRAATPRSRAGCSRRRSWRRARACSGRATGARRRRPGVCVCLACVFLSRVECFGAVSAAFCCV